MACTNSAQDAVVDWKAEALKSVSSPMDTQVSDLWLTLFWAALTSPRRSARARKITSAPYESLAIALLTSQEHAMMQIPNMSRVTRAHYSAVFAPNFVEHIENIPPISLRLMSWFQEPKKVWLSPVPLSNFPLKNSFGGELRPDFIFELKHLPSAETAQWDQLRREYNTTLAYHGSPLHNWYSIVSNGLSTSFSKPDESLYGEGIYLSTDPQVAINFRRPGRTWSSSALGDSLSCLLCAEVLHHPASVVRSEADGPNAQAMPGVSLDHRLPRSYLLVKNNLHVRARYLIIWRQTGASRTAKWWMLIVVYALVLLFVAVSRSNNARYIRRAIIHAEKYFQ